MTIRDAVDATRLAVADEPTRAVVRVRAEARLEEGTETALRMGKHAMTVDEPTSIGGTGAGPNPVQVVLGALASCQALTYRYWAEILGIRLDGITIRVEGDLDVRGYFGLDPTVAPGVSSVLCHVTLDGPEDEARYRQLTRTVDEHCPVLDVFTKPVPVERHVDVP